MDLAEAWEKLARESVAVLVFELLLLLLLEIFLISVPGSTRSNASRSLASTPTEMQMTGKT